MPPRTSDLCIPHPSIEKKETCRACLEDLVRKKSEIAENIGLKAKEKREALAKKESQSRPPLPARQKEPQAD